MLEAHTLEDELRGWVCFPDAALFLPGRRTGAKDGHAYYLPACSGPPRRRSPGLWPTPLGQRVLHWVLRHLRRLLLKYGEAEMSRIKAGKVMKASLLAPQSTDVGDASLPVSPVVQWG